MTIQIRTVRSHAAKLWKRIVGRRLFRRQRHGWKATLFHVLVSGLLLFLLCGYVRGPEPDSVMAKLSLIVRDLVRAGLTNGWVHPAIASAVVEVLTFSLFSGAVLILAAMIQRIPGYVGGLILAEFHRRQGHALSALEILLGISLPISVTVALVSHSILSVLACIYFLLVYSALRLANDPVRTDAILNWYVRIRTAASTPVMEENSEDEEEEESDETADQLEEEVS